MRGIWNLGARCTRRAMNLDQLKAVKTIITHDNCGDGLMSAILLKDAYSQVGLTPDIKFVQYGTETYRRLEPGPNQLFCDFSPFIPDIEVAGQKVPDPEKLKPWVDSGALILDHHKGAKLAVKGFGENGIFADETAEPGVAGAVLAFKYVWLPFYTLGQRTGIVDFLGKGEEPVLQAANTVEELATQLENDLKGNVDAHDKAILDMEGEIAWARNLATLVGIRDTWQNHNPRWREACCLGEVLKFYPNEDWLATESGRVLPFHPGNRGFWNERLKLGNLLWTKHEKSIQKCIDKSWRFTSQKGTRVVVFEGVRQSSDVAESLDKQVDLIMAFDYECETPKEGGPTAVKIIFSTRSHTSFNCMAFAKTLGGGGHTKAAGFNVPFHREAFDVEAVSKAAHHASCAAAILNPYALAEVLVDKYEGEEQQGT